MDSFNSRSHAGSDVCPPSAAAPAPRVSIHAPTRGATHPPSLLPRSFCGFNSRSHAGSDSMGSLSSSRFRVSIHAPTRGATDGARSVRYPHRVSIHAPTRGATSRSCLCALFSRFQFTLPRGERHDGGGAFRKRLCFNSRSHAGSDRGGRVAGPPRGRFNSRSHAGSDFKRNRRDMRVIQGFQFTLPRGERRVETFAGGLRCEFQFTLPRGERRQLSQEVATIEMFQFTLPRGERQCLCEALHGAVEFQFTLPRGERRLRQYNIIPIVGVSIHAPTRGATTTTIPQQR